MRNEATEIVTAERALTRLAQAAGTGIKPIFDACTALEELMTYALLRYLDHADGQPEPGKDFGTRSLVRLLDSRRPDLELQFTILPQAIIIEMAEEGPPDNPLEDGSGTTARAERQIQRLRTYTSSLAFERRNGKNVLTVVLSFEPEARAENGPLEPAAPPR
ncbi:MAG TPA: hypothetical protein DD766_05575 [Desulfovibrio sp.]|nr:hypothetical protein [Desulfovibrio sp.]